MAISATSIPVSVARKEAVEDNKHLRYNLAQDLYICYSINFMHKSVLVLFESNSEVNAVHLTFTKEPDLSIRLTDIGAQNIDSITLNTYRMVVTFFSVMDKANWVRLFEEIFLVTNVYLEVVLGISFLTLSSANIDFLD